MFPPENVLSGYAYFDTLLARGIAPVSDTRAEHMLTLNNRVHDGTDSVLTEMTNGASATLRLIQIPFSGFLWSSGSCRAPGTIDPTFSGHVTPVLAWRGPADPEFGQVPPAESAAPSTYADGVDLTSFHVNS